MSTPTCQVPSPKAVSTRPGTDTFGLRLAAETAGAGTAAVVMTVVADRANTAPTAPTVPMVSPAASPPTAAGHRRRSGCARAGATRVGRATTAGPCTGRATTAGAPAGPCLDVVVVGRASSGGAVRC